MNLHDYNIRMECYACGRFYGVTRQIDVNRDYVYIGCQKCQGKVWFKIDHIGTTSTTRYYPNKLTVTVTKVWASKIWEPGQWCWNVSGVIEVECYTSRVHKISMLTYIVSGVNAASESKCMMATSAQKIKLMFTFNTTMECVRHEEMECESGVWLVFTQWLVRVVSWGVEGCEGLLHIL